MAAVRDPREIITPDAFTVAPELLGLPLARPVRRAAAMLIDLVFIALITKAFGFVIFLVAGALLLFRVAKPSRRGGVLRRGAAWAVRGWAVLMLAIFGAVALGKLQDVVQRPRLIVSRQGPALDPQPTPTAAAAQDDTRVQDSSGRQRDTAAIRAYLNAMTRGDSAQAAQLVGAARTAIAGDRIQELERSQRELSEQNRQLGDDVRRARERRGLRRFIAELADDLGVGFGWMAVYFTAFVVIWNGQTPGKRVFGIRIIRLDAKPLTWWLAFERFGGYAASFSTGLLGFAQIIWDRNRQGMHDKIIATVVIREQPGGARLQQPPGSPRVGQRFA